MRILLVGDSEAGAVAPYISSVSRPGEIVSVDSVVGSRIEAWSSGQLSAAIARYNPDIVVVFLGTNNYSDNNLPSMAPVFAQLPVGRTLWIGPTSVQGKTWPINAKLQAAVQGQGIPYVNTESLQIPLRDGIHPTADGARQWLRAIWPFLEQEASAVPPPSPVALLVTTVVASFLVGALEYLIWSEP